MTLTVQDLLDRAVSLYGAEVAVEIVDGPSYTFRQLRSRVLGLAGGLWQRGVRPGDRVGVMAANGICFFDVYLACAALGAAAVPINPRLVEAEVQTIVDDAGLSMVFADADSASVAIGICGDGATIVVDEPDYEALVASEPLRPCGSADSIALIIYTSGTTGRPKGVCLPQSALVFNGITLALSQLLRHDDSFLAMTPLGHAAAGTRVYTHLVQANRHVVLKRFDAGRAIDVMNERGITTTIAVPTQLNRILDEVERTDVRPTSLRTLVYGAAPSPVPLVNRTLDVIGCDLYHGYGLSEATTNVTGLMPWEHVGARARVGSAGRATVGVIVDVVDPEGVPVPDGEIGEVRVATPKLMTGYWRNPDATAAALVDGRLLTGDLGRLEDGYLYLVDRAKDVLISGGVNVYPREIEDVLARHPAVAEAAVVGQADPEWGEVPAAFVVPSGDSPPTLDELSTFCSTSLARFKLPKALFVIGELPRNANGKVLKNELRSRLRQVPDTGASPSR
jgi:long-chain acyl-CoA synthetase